MLALHVPFANPAKVVAFCNGGAFPEVPLILRASNQGVNFVKRILVSHPQHRSKASEIEKDPWFCGAALEKAIAALNLRNDKRSNPQFSNTGVEAGADIVYIPVFQGTLAAGVAAGVPAAVGVPAAAANMYNGKHYNRQFSEIGGEGDNNMVLGRSQSSYPTDHHRRPPSLENRELLTSSIVDDKPEKTGQQQLGSFNHEVTEISENKPTQSNGPIGNINDTGTSDSLGTKNIKPPISRQLSLPMKEETQSPYRRASETVKQTLGYHKFRPRMLSNFWFQPVRPPFFRFHSHQPGLERRPSNKTHRLQKLPIVFDEKNTGRELSITDGKRKK
jgi:hypothetical protein